MVLSVLSMIAILAIIVCPKEKLNYVAFAFAILGVGWIVNLAYIVLSAQ